MYVYYIDQTFRIQFEDVMFEINLWKKKLKRNHDYRLSQSLFCYLNKCFNLK